MMDFVIYFNSHLLKIRKILILCNEELYSQYVKEFPNAFADKPMDPESIEKRLETLNKNSYYWYEYFGNCLASFLDTIRIYGGTKHRELLILSNRLEQSYPE
ncbi:uncharacterized protein J8A68_003831 [[Candida] subhashii]|uniref:Uncharacterized protein n=1 Tax=[Candida] subhashii TaxID=561895 RepID=A0A8J5QID1_9ASCO|nr:uncharacterized protein J8A68_003831 [[Candida] subhashii]KAG7662623.1 hypothetical protein J8A68_003831 [[Candida] subhashii]